MIYGNFQVETKVSKEMKDKFFENKQSHKASQSLNTTCSTEWFQNLEAESIIFELRSQS